ncbi:MAG: hypothetical protein ABI194_03635, partial [Gemmatimonadaceae bacterium]
LRQFAREARVRHAVEIAARPFSRPGRSFVLSRNLEIGADAARVRLNVATTSWFSDSARTTFERQASQLSGEPVTLLLEQLPASTGDIQNFATLVDVNTTAPASAPPSPPTASSNIAAARSDVDLAMKDVMLPDSVVLISYDLILGNDTTSAGPQLRVVYAAPDTLTTQASRIVARQIQNALSMPNLAVSTSALPPLPIHMGSAVSSDADSVAKLLSKYPSLNAAILAGPRVTARVVDSLVAMFRGAAGDSARVSSARTKGHGVVVTFLGRGANMNQR